MSFFTSRLRSIVFSIFITMTELESSFHDDMLNIYIEAKKLKYTATYFYRMVEEHGGLQAAKILIHKC